MTRSARRLRPPILVAFAAVAVFSLIGGGQARADGPGLHSVTVMTRNLDSGTDFGFFVGPNALSPFSLAASATWQEVYVSGVTQRAALVADEIAAATPDLVSVQEASVWSGPRLPIDGTTVTFDPVTALMARLTADGAHYGIVASLTEAELSAGLGPFTVSFLDQDLILARTDLPPGALQIGNVQAQHFSNILQLTLPGFGTVPITRGWLSADVRSGGNRFRFIATHLESFDVTTQVEQAAELALGPARTGMPVILAGDLNTGPNGFADPRHTQELYAYTLLRLSGLRDSWAVTHPGETGYTDSFHTEDPFVDNTTPIQRIDLVMARGVEATDVTYVGTSKVFGLWPSDHAGVVATLEL